MPLRKLFENDIRAPAETRLDQNWTYKETKERKQGFEVLKILVSVDTFKKLVIEVFESGVQALVSSTFTEIDDNFVSSEETQFFNHLSTNDGNYIFLVCCNVFKFFWYLF